MNKRPLLALLPLCSLCFLFTGCSDDDLQGNTTAQTSGSNADISPPRCMAPYAIRRGATLTLNDGTSRFEILLVDTSMYNLTFPTNTDPEKGSYTATPSGDLATLVLTPESGATVRTINLTGKSSTDGTYTSDSLGRGTFTSDGPLFVGGCGPY